ncbi:hypothetical protein TELCIR_15404 [Teladorsagia circumcincta]|uniref:Secreted protein n=1 Tax=Teladorsagia circumcincta TaxID=45464 RepID=A0A2G9TYG5_TELCI|nr:hypothetical protein TELCIR_15404 [Teladorsagia circumcincta]
MSYATVATVTFLFATCAQAQVFRLQSVGAIRSGFQPSSTEPLPKRWEQSMESFQPKFRSSPTWWSVRSQLGKKSREQD